MGEKAGAGPFRAQGRGKRALLRAEVGALPEFEEQVPVGAPRRKLALRLQILARKGGEVLAVAVGPVHLRFGIVVTLHAIGLIVGGDGIVVFPDHLLVRSDFEKMPVVGGGDEPVAVGEFLGR